VKIKCGLNVVQIGFKNAASGGVEEINGPEEMNGGPLACPGGNVTIAMERWSMEPGIILNTPRYCELCLCTCMTPMDTSDQQYFDARSVVADTSNGMIITAVRFTKENQVIRLAVRRKAEMLRFLVSYNVHSIIRCVHRLKKVNPPSMVK